LHLLRIGARSNVFDVRINQHFGDTS